MRLWTAEEIYWATECVGDDADIRPDAFIDAKEFSALKETVISLWDEHQKTKFLSDGSHFQADIKFNEFIAGLRKP